MVRLYLLIADESLREAVVEQMKRAALEDPVCVATAQTFLSRRDADELNIVVVDEAKSEAETEAALAALAQDEAQPIVLFLGRNENRDGVVETFVKPFRLGHLMARLEYYVENAPHVRASPVVFGPYRLDPQQRWVCRKGLEEPIRLTEKETALLLFLAQRATPAPRRDILEAVWGYGDKVDTHTLETHIYQLRRKLDRDGESWILSDAGSYRLAGRAS
ncbi:MAG: winged helix-turn-helix domain-containing protein [Alphaproteobacteria bacterium]|nr:winged helix-turn-helix domain-containing protein [Alphaproteobacteria bacterium]